TWLWVRLGSLRSRRVLGVILFTAAASALGVVAAIIAGMLVPSSLPDHVEAWISLFVQAVVGLGVSFGALAALKVDELSPLTSRLSGVVKRG
ncbi:MAG: murein biosynthesis integral membrane protein MurJ, partial [Haloechinothrix sp.]